MLLKKLLPIVSLVPQVISTLSSYTQEVCITQFASTKPACGTVISTTQAETFHLTAFQKITTTPSVTITEQGSTFTSTTTSTVTSTSTLTQVTDTFSSTSTVFATTTTIIGTVSTESDTITLTVTESPSTVYISTSAGFTPIASGNPGAAKIKARNNAIRGSRKIAPVSANNRKKVVFNLSDGHISCSPTQYPVKVTCNEAVEIVTTRTLTYTASHTVTKTTVAPAQTQTETATFTSTITTMPIDASTTITILSTDTLTSTSVSTSVTTTTITSTVADVAGATPTSYAACAANNIVSSYNGSPIDQGNFFEGYVAALSSDSPYDCCVACQTYGGCGGTLFYAGTCYLSNDAGTCDGSVVDAYFYAASGGFTGISVSNGPCGQQIYQAS